MFPFFADAANLGEITPPWLEFGIRTPLPIPMGVGTRIDYRLRLHGVPFSWRTEISQWQPPESFIDRQLRGPYHLWIHEHLFIPVPEGTQVVDRVRYRPRGGALVHALFVRRNLSRIFTFRQQKLIARFGGRAGEVSVAPLPHP